LSNNSGRFGGGIINGYYCTLTLTNSILWGNTAIEAGNEIYSYGEDYGSLIISHCNIKGCGYSGTGWNAELGIDDGGNIDDDPLFIDPIGVDNIIGTEDDNLRLSVGSPCIDAGAEVGVYEDIEGNVRPWDFPCVDNNSPDVGEFDMGAYEYVGVESALKLTPQTLNCRSQGKWVKAHLTLPEGFTIADIDTNTPATLQPMNLTSAHLKVSLCKDGLVKVNASFDRKEFCRAVGDLSEGLTVFAYFADGAVFYGTASVRIITPGLQELAELSAYWLQSNCDKPDWCNGLDLNHDSVVNMLDFALFQKSNIEFIDK